MKQRPAQIVRASALFLALAAGLELAAVPPRPGSPPGAAPDLVADDAGSIQAYRAMVTDPLFDPPVPLGIEAAEVLADHYRFGFEILKVTDGDGPGAMRVEVDRVYNPHLLDDASPHTLLAHQGCFSVLESLTEDEVGAPPQYLMPMGEYPPQGYRESGELAEDGQLRPVPADGNSLIRSLHFLHTESYPDADTIAEWRSVVGMALSTPQIRAILAGRQHPSEPRAGLPAAGGVGPGPGARTKAPAAPGSTPASAAPDLVFLDAATREARALAQAGIDLACLEEAHPVANQSAETADVASKEPAQKPARKALKTESRLRQVEREAKAHLRNLEKKAQARMLAEVRRQEKLALEFEREQQRLARLALDQENTRKQRQRRLERLREAEREQAEAFALVERQRESKAERVATALAEPGETPVQEQPGPVAAAPAAAGDPPGFVPPTARAPGRFDRLLVSPLTREHRRPEGDGFAARVYDQLFRQAASESDLAP